MDIDHGEGVSGCGGPRRAPSFASSVFRVFRVAGVNPFRGRKGFFLGLLALLPMLIMLAGRVFGVDRGSGYLFFVVYLVPFYHYINLIVFIFLGCSALGESIEDKTISYDLVCPLRRVAIYWGRGLSFLSNCLVILLPALWGAYALCMLPFGAEAIVRNISSLLAVTMTTLFAALVYGSFFLCLSLLVKRAVLIAIVLAICVDGFLAYIPLSISACSPLVHLRNLMSAVSGETRFLEMPDAGVIQIDPGWSLGVLLGLCVLCTAGGAWAFVRKQFL